MQEKKQHLKKIASQAIEKNDKTKTKTKLGQVVLYEKQDDTTTLDDDIKFVFENQKNDLKKNGHLTLDRFASEFVFFDLFMKDNKINKSILTLDKNKKKDKICKMFLDIFSKVDTPNDKNYERHLIEKLTNKIIIENLENSYNKQDKKDLQNIKITLDDLENLKNDYRLLGYKKLDDIEGQKQLAKQYRQQYQKHIQKQLKARYRLAKKYSFLVS